MTDFSFWDNRYSENASVYGTRPNVYLKEKIDPLPCGSILFPAEGEGRNAIYAASIGWEVFAYDASSVAQQKALNNAALAKVDITYDVASSNAYQPNNQLDAIAFIYAHMPASERKELHQKAISWLNPGGVIILEGFAKEQLNYQSGGPKDISMLYDVEDLKNEFATLDILEVNQTEILLDEGPFHQGKASVVRILAKKPL